MAYEVLEDNAVDDPQPRVSSRFKKQLGHAALVTIFTIVPAGIFADRAYNAAQKATAVTQSPLSNHGLDSSTNPVNNAVADSLMAFAAGLAGGLGSNFAFEQIDEAMARRGEREED